MGAAPAAARVELPPLAAVPALEPPPPEVAVFAEVVEVFPPLPPENLVLPTQEAAAPPVPPTPAVPDVA